MKADEITKIAKVLCPNEWSCEKCACKPERCTNRANAERSWATVVRNTFIAFQFEPEHKVMVELYIKGRKLKELLCDGLWETTFYRWRDHWLEYAYKWAKKFGLL